MVSNKEKSFIVNLQDNVKSLNRLQHELTESEIDKMTSKEASVYITSLLELKDKGILNLNININSNIK